MSAGSASSFGEIAGLEISQADLILLSESLFSSTNDENEIAHLTPDATAEGTYVAGATGAMQELPKNDAQADNEDAWITDFLAVFDKVGVIRAQTFKLINLSLLKDKRWRTRKLAMNDINLLSLTQKRSTLLDKRKKGGNSFILRCSSAVRNSSGCPFYCKLRHSPRDDKWYVCRGFHPVHACARDRIPPKYSDIEAMLALSYHG